ncbi:MAG: Gfo/Idh/MocA family oxidoreductase [Planctomycetota bacterium]|nr:Gfo/Idh/MocA family oxidoreductase [Planctomycetota bacterium]
MKVAVVGCGYWGRNLVRNIHALNALGAVVEKSPGAQKKARELAPQVPVYPELPEALKDAAIQGVMIATPAETHHELACAALQAGKDVFVEKPLTLEVASSRDLVARAAKAGKLLMVGHLLEYHPAILKVRELISSGELGRIRYIISNRLNLGKIRTEENALWSFAPHDIAVILRLVGQMPFEVVTTGGCYLQPNIADVTVTQLLFDSGVRAHVFVSWLHPFKEQRMVIVGSRKMVSYDDVSKELLLYDQHVDWQEGQPIPVNGGGTKVAFPQDEPLRRECQHFVDCMRERRAPLTDGLSGVRVLRILHAAQRSLITNGQPVQFGLDE